MIATYIILVGLIIGSFLNVCIYRIPRNESIAYPPSHCTNCDNKIAWYDLIPVLSWLILKGSCRHCKTRISFKYPLIEVLTAIIFGGIYYKYGITLKLVKYLIFAALLIVIGLIDLETTDIYDNTIIFGLVFGVLFMMLEYFQGENVLSYFYAALIGGGIISFIILLTKGMGWGDAELCLICGLYLGLKGILIMLFLSFVLGGVISALLMLFKIKKRKDYVPFGPFITLSAFITLFIGNELLGFYLTSFF